MPSVRSGEEIAGKRNMQHTEVIIVGAGPSGLATAACLNELSVPNVVLEREACTASLWKLRAYDRLKLHLAKRFCALPHMAFPPDAPTFIPREQFVRYLDEYASRFAVAPVTSTVVEMAAFDLPSSTWRVAARNAATGELAEYRSRFLVVATGENSSGFIPDVPGLKSFPGEVVHSSLYKSGKGYAGKRVLVVGSGNSGMEIADDLCCHGAETSIVIRSPVHVLTKEMIYLGMVTVKYIPVGAVDSLLRLLANLRYGDLSKYGIVRPSMGPLAIKLTTGKSSVIDTGTVGKIKAGDIKVMKAVNSIKGKVVEFEDGQLEEFDSIVFATGFRSTAQNWLKDGASYLGLDGLPKESVPNHWKGSNGLYSVGFGRAGLAGVAMDAQRVADDIKQCWEKGKSEIN